MSDAPAPSPFRDTARNLLFGLLALQNSFISRDALVAAFGAWIADKSKPLDRILLDQGHLDADCHALLNGLVRQHLKLHGDDPEKSLASLSAIGLGAPPPDGAGRRPTCPPASATSARPAAGDLDPDATATFLGAPTSAGGRFQVLRLHAEGGLGEVYVARDEEVHREVALKQIKAEHADDPQGRARFLLEAEITGGLEHPGIVPVYGLGTYDDGRPFYAMRFIRGDSLKDAIAPVPRRRGHAAGPRPAHPGAATSCCGGSWTSATRSATPTAAGCCTATSSRATSCSATTARRWWSTGAWPRRSGTTWSPPRRRGRSGRSGPSRARTCSRRRWARSRARRPTCRRSRPRAGSTSWGHPATSTAWGPPSTPC